MALMLGVICNYAFSQAVYMDVFLANETNEDVWFDDFSVMSITPNVVQGELWLG